MRKKRTGVAPRLRNFVARHRRSTLIRKVADVSRTYLEWYGNFSYDVCARVSATTPPVRR
ncbi:MAG: hypothetical protein OES47_02970 [Acidobacteriota bacterium]|nr:hypothetical protein [Acidobacteriota bacterium]